MATRMCSLKILADKFIHGNSSNLHEELGCRRVTHRSAFGGGRRGGTDRISIIKAKGCHHGAKKMRKVGLLHRPAYRSIASQQKANHSDTVGLRNNDNRIPIEFRVYFVLKYWLVERISSFFLPPSLANIVSRLTCFAEFGGSFAFRAQISRDHFSARQKQVCHRDLLIKGW